MPQPSPRFILHVDLDAFFASVAQLDDPSIRGKPVLVGGTSRRGVVTAASYEARVYGCRSAQPMSLALRLCPHAIVRPVPGDRIRECSRQFIAILESFTPLVQPLSVDEAFLDVTGSLKLFGPAPHIAQEIRRRVKEQIGLTVSVGVAPNKFLAKLASDMNKPDGLTVIEADKIEETLSPLPIGRIWGIGPKTQEKLADFGVKTIGDLRKLPADFLRNRFGIEADRYLKLSAGDDEREVVPDHEAKSIGQERTFGVDLIDADHVREALLGQVEQVAARLRRYTLLARGVTLKIRDGEFNTISRSGTLDAPTDVTGELWSVARHIFDNWAATHFKPVRLIGMQATRLTRSPEEATLFADPSHEKHKKLDRAVDAIQQKFGKTSISRAKTQKPRHRDRDDDDD